MADDAKGADRQAGAMTELPDVTRTWLRFDDSFCVRCEKWAGPMHDVIYVVKGEGLVHPECATDDEKARAHEQR